MGEAVEPSDLTAIGLPIAKTEIRGLHWVKNSFEKDNLIKRKQGRKFETNACAKWKYEKLSWYHRLPAGTQTPNNIIV